MFPLAEHRGQLGESGRSAPPYGSVVCRRQSTSRRCGPQRQPGLLAGTRGEAPVFLGVATAVFAVAGAAARALADVPLVGLAVFHAASGYALLTTAHLAGLLFRRHRERLERIYLD